MGCCLAPRILITFSIPKTRWFDQWTKEVYHIDLMRLFKTKKAQEAEKLQDLFNMAHNGDLEGLRRFIAQKDTPAIILEQPDECKSIAEEGTRVTVVRGERSTT